MLGTVVGLLAYILGSVGYYSIAKRRGIHHAWLAWVPVGNLWLLGCISDQYQSVMKGKTKNKRTVLMILSIVQTLCVIAAVVICIVMFVQLLTAINPGDFGTEIDQLGSDFYIGDFYLDDLYGEMGDQMLPAEVMGAALGMVGAGALLCLLTIPLIVVQYIALYDLFASCDPSNAVLFLLLSIFLNIGPFLVFVCRDRDFGMMRIKPPAYQPPTPAADSWEQNNG